MLAVSGLVRRCGCDTNRIEQNCKEQLSSTDALVQLLRASWIIFIEDGMCEKPTGLPGENLIHKTEMRAILGLIFLYLEYLMENFKAILVTLQ